MLLGSERPQTEGSSVWPSATGPPTGTPSAQLADFDVRLWWIASKGSGSLAVSPRGPSRSRYVAFGVPDGNGVTGPFFASIDPKQLNTPFPLLSAGTNLFPLI